MACSRFRVLAWICGLLLLCFGPSALLAQDSGSIAGVVVSTWDGSPMPAVTVTVRGTTLAGQTDAQGRFQINQVPAGDHEVRFSKSGFASVTVSDVHVLAGQTTTVNGNVRPEFFEMEELRGHRGGDSHSRPKRS